MNVAACGCMWAHARLYMPSERVGLPMHGWGHKVWGRPLVFAYSDISQKGGTYSVYLPDTINLAAQIELQFPLCSGHSSPTLGTK